MVKKKVDLAAMSDSLVPARGARSVIDAVPGLREALQNLVDHQMAKDPNNRISKRQAYEITTQAFPALRISGRHFNVHLDQMGWKS